MRKFFHGKEAKHQLPINANAGDAAQGQAPTERRREEEIAKAQLASSAPGALIPMTKTEMSYLISLSKVNHMSFSFEFFARNPADAMACLNEQHSHIPGEVRTIVLQALSGCDSHHPVHVRGQGHVFAPGSWDHTTVDLKVTPIKWWDYVGGKHHKSVVNTEG